MKSLKLPIFIKIFFITTVIVSTVTLFTSYKIANYFESISTRREEEIGLNVAKSQITEFDTYIKNIIDKSKFYASIFLNSSEKDLSESLKNDSDIVEISIWDSKNLSKPIKTLTRNDYLKKYNVNFHSLNLQSKMNNALLLEVITGKIKTVSSTIKGKMPLLWISYPLQRNSNQEVTLMISIFVNMEKLISNFNSIKDYEVILFDENKNIISAKDEDQIINAHKFEPTFNIQNLYDNKVFTGQELVSTKKAKTLVSFSKSLFGPILISSIDEAIYKYPIYYVKGQSLFILAICLSLSISIITLFSNSLTKPIETLLYFTKQIAKGVFDLPIVSTISSHDEVGGLANAMQDMTKGLKEREKIKHIFDKFHGASVAQELLNKEVALQGSKKRVVVFFSDIRSFTKYSEAHTAEEVVSMLNEYMDAMVKVIYKNGGVVDKFVGDAIMAVWGVPEQTEDDVKNSITACLEMRTALDELNQKRILRGEEPIMIGMGLHYGDVISGTVGSEDRMEYTIIGDTVNTAARIESSTKSFGTDLLISDELQNELAGKFITKKAGSISAKGKSQDLTLFTVEGFMTSEGIHQIVKTPYSHYEASHDEKTKVVA